MKRSYQLLLAIVLILVLIFCLNKVFSEPFKIEVFPSACSLDTIKSDRGGVYITQSYLVSGYNNTLVSEETIDQFACQVHDSLKNEYDNCVLLFYKKTKITNHNMRIDDLNSRSYENDLLFTYRCINGFLSIKQRLHGQEYLKEFNCP
jgi:hypothetical protein